MRSNRFGMSTCGREFHIACSLLKMQDADHERDADQPNSTQAPYSANKLAMEEDACAALTRSLEKSLQRVGVHYPAET
ncbi:hypothetical protein TNCV_75121 [Trichonephila clavipes]|nr:hypothetical protein TNCV_75121 [Trichonephila clavipes]